MRLFGDLVVLAHFSGAKATERETARATFAHAVSDGDGRALRGRVDERREADPPLVPFHWEVEFPEVFERENGGFDAIVGNPPFAGQEHVSSAQPATATSTGCKRSTRARTATPTSSRTSSAAASLCCASAERSA